MHSSRELLPGPHPFTGHKVTSYQVENSNMNMWMLTAGYSEGLFTYFSIVMHIYVVV